MKKYDVTLNAMERRLLIQLCIIALAEQEDICNDRLILKNLITKLLGE